MYPAAGQVRVKPQIVEHPAAQTSTCQFMIVCWFSSQTLIVAH